MVREAQGKICRALSDLDGKPFRGDPWQREGGGGGLSCVLQRGAVFEKAGVNVAVVHGHLPSAAVQSMGGGHRLSSSRDDTEVDFFAAGLSLVVHPQNPFAPTAHCNYRYFEVGPADGEAWWFGGGADLTPSYLFREDAEDFHRVYRDVCQRFDAKYYARFKAWCDRYFFLPHRGETRGVGGIFFDDLHGEPEQLFAFCEACADAFVPSYVPIVARRKDHGFAEEHKLWQQLRRGRYVEFNLLYDRGTTFGLRSGGRTESILMSLPLTARWEYAYEPKSDSAEASLLAVLRQPQQWV